MDEMVRVWVGADRDVQHLSSAPSRDDTAHAWSGTTVCGVSGDLRWIPGERVDTGSACRACLGGAGTAPPLEGAEPGPV